jgi:cell wall-associated NlpC family hydrolase
VIKVLGAMVTVAAVGLLLVAAVIGAASGASAAGNPNAAGVTCTSTGTDRGGAAPAGSGVRLSPAQMHNAQLIVAVVRSRHLPRAAAQVALMTALQESSLTVVDHGDAAGPDSRGLFQQRASWGPLPVRMDPARSSGLFLDRLVNLPGWQGMDPAAAAHAVQRNTAAADYTRWVPLSTALTDALMGADPAPLSCTGGTLLPAASPSARAAVALTAAGTALGRPYCFDGGDANGPTHGQGGEGCPPGTLGFDCSGLTLYAWAQAGVDLPHYSGDQYDRGRKIPIRQAAPGDLVFLANAAEGIHHVAMIWSVNAGTRTGSGRIIEAQDFTVPVHIRPWRGVDEPHVMPYAVRLAA